MAVGRSLDLQPLERLNPLNFHKISVWRHRTQHGFHSIVAPSWLLAMRAAAASAVGGPRRRRERRSATAARARVRKGKGRMGGEEEERKGEERAAAVAVAVSPSASRHRRLAAAMPAPHRCARSRRRPDAAPGRRMRRYSVAVDTAHGSCLQKQKASTEDTAAGLEPATSTLNNLSA